MSPPLVRYVPLMFRDYLLTRGGAMLVVATVFVLPSLLMWSQTELPADAMRTAAAQTLLGLAPFLALVGVYGLVGYDFRQGYFRTLFAQPVVVPAYFAALAGCAFAAFVVVNVIAMAVYAGIGVDVVDAGLALEAGLRFAVLGSMVFALSRITRLDWLFALFFQTIAGPMRGLYPAAESLRGRIIDVVFPPTHLLDLSNAARRAGQLSALVPEAGVLWADVGWLAGYALACCAIGLLLVRKVPLGSA